MNRGLRKMQTTWLGLILFLAAEPALVSGQKVETTSEKTLYELLANHFGELSGAEERLANAAANGETANCKDLPGADKEIRAGCVYDRIEPASAVDQLRWLELQDYHWFRAQPFDQLASVFRKMGLEEEVRMVMIAKNEEHARYVEGRPEWLWFGFFGHLVGYGYSTERTFFFGIAVILIGWRLFRRGYRRGLITPTKGVEYAVGRDGTHPFSEDHPKFNAFVYSLETFVPLVKLGVAEYWEPNGHRSASRNPNKLHSPPQSGSLLLAYLRFHIIGGWFITTLWVGLWTGIVKA
jgi:hypothetical protein